MARKVKTFFHVLRSSFLPNSFYYPHIPRVSLSFSLQYFFALVFFLNVVFFSALFVRLMPGEINSLRSSVKQSVTEFPSELVVQITEGRLRTNYDRPYLWWVNYENKKILAAVIDEGATPDKIKEYNSYLLFTGSSLVVNSDKVRPVPQIFPYTKEMVVDQNVVNKWGDQFDSLFSFGGILLIPLFLGVVPLLFGVWALLYVLVLSAVVQPLYVFFFDKNHKFLSTFQISLHAVTLPLVLYFVLLFFNITGDTFSVLPIVFVNLIIVFILSGLYETYLAGHPRRSHARVRHSTARPAR